MIDVHNQLGLIYSEEKFSSSEVQCVCLAARKSLFGITKSVYETILKRSGFDTVITLIMC